MIFYFKEVAYLKDLRRRCHNLFRALKSPALSVSKFAHRIIGKKVARRPSPTSVSTCAPTKTTADIPSWRRLPGGESEKATEAATADLLQQYEGN